MKYLRLLPLVLFVLSSVCSAASIYGPTVFFGDVSIGSWAAPTGITAAVTSGGSYTNGAVTNYYRLSATNKLGRIPESSNVVVVVDGNAGTNAVALTWRQCPGVDAHVVEISRDAGASWTNWLTVGTATTNWTDTGTNAWQSGSFTSVYATIAAPAVPWSSAEDLATHTSSLHGASSDWIGTWLGLGTNAFASSNQGAKADTAYGWGNHAEAGYLTAETDPAWAAWLLATPPVMEEDDPDFAAWLQNTPPVMAETDPDFDAWVNGGYQGVLTAEDDPDFAAWLQNTPPVMEEADPDFDAWVNGGYSGVLTAEDDPSFDSWIGGSSFAFGSGASAQSAGAFVVNGDSQAQYGDSGAGTICFNPIGVNDGFYIGTTNITTFIENLRLDWTNAAREATSIGLGDTGNGIPIVHHEYKGITMRALAGENLYYGQVCYLTSGPYINNMLRAQANSTNTATVSGMCVSESITANQVGTFLVLGYADSDGGEETYTYGTKLYLSDTDAGVMTNIIPSAIGTCVEPLAVYVYPGAVYFNPSQQIVTNKFEPVFYDSTCGGTNTIAFEGPDSVVRHMYRLEEAPQ